MKKIISVALLLLSLSVYSQVSIPENSRQGIITTKTDEIIEYRNLKYENGKVVYTNKNNNEQEFLYDNSVKSIKEIDGSLNAKADTYSLPENKDGDKIQKLSSKKEIKQYLLQQNNSQYKSGRTINSVGTALVVGGAATFFIGGISNLSSANKTYAYGEEPKGSPVPLIIGLIGAGAGVVLKLTGHSQMKSAINQYKNADAKKFTPSFYALNNRNGMGLMMKF